MTLEEDQPLLWLVTAGLFLALILLVPAAVEAALRGYLAFRRYFVASRLARFREGDLPGEPSARFDSDGDSASQDHDKSIDRGVPG
jgi:hypothetical protein